MASSKMLLLLLSMALLAVTSARKAKRPPNDQGRHVGPPGEKFAQTSFNGHPFQGPEEDEEKSSSSGGPDAHKGFPGPQQNRGQPPRGRPRRPPPPPPQGQDGPQSPQGPQQNEGQPSQNEQGRPNPPPNEPPAQESGAIQEEQSTSE